MKKIHGSWGFIGGNLGAVAWLLPSLSLPSGTLYIEGFWEENFHWIFFSEGHLEAYRASWASWWLFGYCFWETNILWLCALPLIVKVKKTFWRFKVEAHVAYTCKQILGLCQAVIRKMPNRVKLYTLETTLRIDAKMDVQVGHCSERSSSLWYSASWFFKQSDDFYWVFSLPMKIDSFKIPAYHHFSNKIENNWINYHSCEPIWE